MFGILTMIGLVAAIITLLFSAVPISSARIHKSLLQSVMSAPLAFFLATDTGMTPNR